MVRRGDWETYFCFLLSRFQLFPTFGTTSARPWHDLGTTWTDTKPLQTLPWHDVTTCTHGSRGEKDAETRRWPETEIQQGKDRIMDKVLSLRDFIILSRHDSVSLIHARAFPRLKIFWRDSQTVSIGRVRAVPCVRNSTKWDRQSER